MCYWVIYTFYGYTVIWCSVPHGTLPGKSPGTAHATPHDDSRAERSFMRFLIGIVKNGVNRLNSHSPRKCWTVFRD